MFKLKATISILSTRPNQIEQVHCGDASVAPTGRRQAHPCTNNGRRKKNHASNYVSQKVRFKWLGSTESVAAGGLFAFGQGCWTLAVYMWALLQIVDPLWQVVFLNRFYFTFRLVCPVCPVCPVFFCIASVVSLL